MDEADGTAAKWLFNFAIHHIFPRELYSGDIGAFLSRIGLPVDSRGNKVALIGSPSLASLVSGVASLATGFLKAGWGVVAHFGFHDEYNLFLKNALAEILAENPERQSLLAFELFKFAADVSIGQKYPNLSLSTVTADALRGVWTGLSRTANDLPLASIPERIAELTSGLDFKTLTDRGVETNTEERYKRVASLLQYFKGLLDENVIKAVTEALDLAKAGVKLDAGQISSAAIQLLGNIAVKQLGGNVTFAQAIEIIGARIYTSVARFAKDEFGGKFFQLERSIQSIGELLMAVKNLGTEFFTKAADVFKEKYGPELKRAFEGMLTKQGLALTAVMYLDKIYDDFKLAVTKGNFAPLILDTVVFAGAAAVGVVVITGCAVLAEAAAIAAGLSLTAAESLGALVTAGYGWFRSLGAISCSAGRWQPDHKNIERFGDAASKGWPHHRRGWGRVCCCP